jgi:ABC-type glycerol-3-phosphate transport system permease component
LVIVQDKDLNVLSVGMTNYSQPYQREPMWAAAIAASTVATLPIAAALRVLPTKLCKGSDCCGGEG